MTKSESREFDHIRMCITCGWLDIAARSLSALVRATMSKRTKSQLCDFAESYGLTNHPDFII